ncbi:MULTISPECIES: hypothetical protein [Acidobacteriaceae]|uniref:hypothetical protein n=1 Tax=Acidobacteriaceae TaxID=204434 RepID=UPI00131E6F2F|nr:MULTISPECIES: hypothetical protein [Acidobacteriaceae]MDW5266921.1 hypothetical protein [Edaphobacter sp.]
MLTGRPGNFVRIPESQYTADIAAAEERGRASASQTAQSSTVAAAAPTAAEAAEPTREQKDAVEQVKVLQAAEAARNADDPKALAERITAHIAEQKNGGRRIGYALAAKEVLANK